MKNALIALCLTLCACVASPAVLRNSGALGRQVHRVVLRHDAYVRADAALPLDKAEADLKQSAALDALASLPEVSLPALGEALTPVATRHDAYVSADASLDQLERETYLGSTQGLRDLIAGK